MGTSTGYSAPPSWSDLKSDVTRGAGLGTLPANVPSDLVQSFIRHNGGANAIARGGASGAGGTVARGRAARSIAGSLGGFLADIGRSGLSQALRNAGWSDLIGRPVQEILASLLDRLGGESSTIDDVDARMALARLEEQYFGTAVTPDELEQLLVAQANRLEAVLEDFFGNYLFEVFCRVFFERLVQRVGETRAHSFLGQIGDFIKSTLANRVADRDISQINWAGSEGEQLSSEIMETTLVVFGG